MAINIAGMQQLPDIMGNFQRGYQVGQLQRADERKRADEQKLRDLAPQVIAGDPTAYANAAVIDPKAAGEYQGAGDAQTRRIEPLVKLLEEADARDPREAQALWTAHGIPFARQFSQGTEPTPDWQQAKPMIQGLKLKIAQAKAGQGNGSALGMQILDNGNIGVVTRDNQVIDTGRKAAPTTQVINEPGQTPYLVTTGRGTIGQTTGIGPGAGAAPPAAPPQPPQRMEDSTVNMIATEMSRAGMPEAQVDAWLQMQKSQPMYVGGGGTGGPAPAPAAGPVAQRNPTAAEVEAAKTAAREQVELANLPQRGAIEAQNAGRVTSAQEQAKLDVLPEKARIEAAGAGATEEAKQKAQTRVELEQLLPKVRSDSERAIALIDRALNHPGREAATGLSSVNPLNQLPGSDARNFRVLLEQLKGGTFLQAFQSLKGGGAITEREGQKAEQAIARLDAAQSDDEFIRALQDLRIVAESLPGSIQQKLIAASESPQSGNVSRPTTEADYNAIPSGGLFIDPDDGRTYRKP